MDAALTELGKHLTHTGIEVDPIRQSVALANEGALHVERKAHLPHDLGKIPAKVLPVHLERRFAVADHLSKRLRECKAHHLE
jgi:hypothetical protein